MSANTHSSAVAYKLTIGGTVMTQSKNDGVIQIIFEDHIDMVGMLTVRFGGGESQPKWAFSVGDEVKLKLGSGHKEIFAGEIISLEPGFEVAGISSMTIRALDKMHRLGRGRKTRYWEEKKDSDVATVVGQECGLSVSADTTPEVHGYILQRNESNIAFIKRLAARNNHVVRVNDGKLDFKKASFNSQSLQVGMGKNLKSLKLSFNTTDLVQEVIVRGWDTKAKKEIVGKASSGDVTKIGGGALGADLAGKFGSSKAYITDVPVATQGQANAVAKAEMERLARQFCKGSCTVSGDDKALAGTALVLSGLPTGQNGKFFIIASRHVISKGTGYTTEMQICSNTLGT
jgi:phage protein D